MERDNADWVLITTSTFSGPACAPAQGRAAAKANSRTSIQRGMSKTLR
jgi:hypothetical protein